MNDADDIAILARVLIRILETGILGYDHPQALKQGEANEAKHALLDMIERREASGEQPST